MDKNLHNTTNEQIKSLLQFKKYSVPSVDQKLYEDKYITKEQNNRDKEITKLLRAYVTTYENKVKISSRYQKFILYYNDVLRESKEAFYNNEYIFDNIKLLAAYCVLMLTVET